MDKKLSSNLENDYIKRISGRFPQDQDPQSLGRLKAALSRAESIRDFEIGLYWTRSTYFWGFQAVFFASFGLVAQVFIPNTTGEPSNVFALVILSTIAVAGSIVSYLWLLMLQGAKHWQDNWERHIDILEDYVYGPLYKTYFIENIPEKKCNVYESVPKEYRPISVTQVNKRISQIVIVLWSIIAITSLCFLGNVTCNTISSSQSLFCVIAVFFILMFSACFAQGQRNTLRMKFFGKLQTHPSSKVSHQMVFRELFETNDSS